MTQPAAPPLHMPRPEVHVTHAPMSKVHGSLLLMAVAVSQFKAQQSQQQFQNSPTH